MGLNLQLQIPVRHRAFAGAGDMGGEFGGHRKSGARLFPSADTGGDSSDRFVAQKFSAFAGVVAVPVLELQKKASHAQRAKRGSERLVTGGSQFGRIERISFHALLLV